MSERDQVERRRHERFSVEKKAFARLRAHVSKLGQIVNVSEGGLAFRYISTGKKLTGSIQIDIWITDNGFRLDNVWVRVVSDRELADASPFSFLKMRQLGVEFAELTRQQFDQLELFIQKYAGAAA